MNKKQSTEIANPRTSGGAFEFTEADTAAATSLGIVLSGGLDERISRAVYAFNNATRYAVEAGYLLLSVKAEVERGQFESGIHDLGLSSQRASELMRMAKFATALPEERRAEMLMLPKSKVLALAAADAAVIEDLLSEDGGTDLDALTVRELRDRIKEAEAQLADAAVERDTAIAERDGLAKKLKKRARDAEDHEGTPVVIADIRAEVAALIHKGELSVESLHPVLVELVGYSGHEQAGEWVTPSLRFALSGLVALRLQIDGAIKSCVDALGDDSKKLQSGPDSLAFLDEAEIRAVGEEWPRLVGVHEHESSMRAHERKQAKPRGKGRPEAAPKAPKA
ncbi:hypothetical protein [Variovorax paradoxus]|uniref:DUF3102 domain-containing protein n=1 Tax=Variovorax paradoxus TaxID=34073 RepID=A0A0H2LY59_VARPD|nr:hypothetical protein [Variovorax paradoxus]KLN54706.1 hypothetical protein VPARA_40100 [Variovorax paradoxus]